MCIRDSRWTDWAGPGFPAPVVTIHDAGSDSVRVADLDGDGRADLYTLSGYPATVGIWLGAGDGSFIHAQTWTSSLALAPDGSVLATVGLSNGQLAGFNDHDLWIGRFTR